MEWQKVKMMHPKRIYSKANPELFSQFTGLMGFNQCEFIQKVKSFPKWLNNKHAYNTSKHVYFTRFDEQLRNTFDHGEIYRNSKIKLPMAVSHLYCDPENLVGDAVVKIAPVVNGLNAYYKNKLNRNLPVRAVIFKPGLSWYYPEKAMLIIYMSNEAYRYYKDDLEKYGGIAALI